MLKNKLLQKDNNIVRVLETENDKALIVNCIKRSVPQWISTTELTEYAECSINDLSEITGVCPRPIDELENESRRIAYERFTIIAGVLLFIADYKSRCNAISNMAQHFNISKQTIKQYLWVYLVYQNISVLAPKKCSYEKPLTTDEKNMRWALNKYFYNQNRNSFQTAYTLMLKEKYCDSSAVLYHAMSKTKYMKQSGKSRYTKRFVDDMRKISGVKKNNIDRVIPYLPKHTDRKTADAIIKIIEGK